MKVYVITSGEYSDYHIDTVSVDYEQARRICATMNANITYDYHHIEEYDTDTVKVFSTHKNVGYMYKTSWKNGRESFYGGEFVMEFQRRNKIRYKDGILWCEVYVPDDSKKSKEKAKKIAYDMKAQWEAEQAGL